MRPRFCLPLAVLLVLAGAARAVETIRDEAGQLADVRARFAEAVDSASAARELVRFLDAQPKPDQRPVLQAYRAALEGLVGKHAHAPWTKYRHAKEGLARFEGLVEANPDSIEIRMLRFTTCKGLPEFFGMGPQAGADIGVLVELLATGADPELPEDLRRGYLRWILEQGGPDPEQRRRLERALAALPPDS